MKKRAFFFQLTYPSIGCFNSKPGNDTRWCITALVSSSSIKRGVVRPSTDRERGGASPFFGQGSGFVSSPPLDKSGVGPPSSWRRSTDREREISFYFFLPQFRLHPSSYSPRMEDRTRAHIPHSASLDSFCRVDLIHTSRDWNMLFLPFDWFQNWRVPMKAGANNTSQSLWKERLVLELNRRKRKLHETGTEKTRSRSLKWITADALFIPRPILSFKPIPQN